MQTSKHIRKFILSSFLFSEDESRLQDEQSLIETGVLDSTGVLELIAFLEEQFRISVADEEMLPENLDSVARIAEFVERKQA